jgi:hypothetical protein
MEQFICDTCSLPCQEVWTFLHGEFAIEGPDAGGRMLRTQAPAGEWAACNDCAAFIVQGDVEGLVRRSIEVNKATHRNVISALTAMQTAFMEHLVKGSIRRCAKRSEFRVV